MESPLLQPVPTPKRKVVVGTHETASNIPARFRIRQVFDGRCIDAVLGHEGNKSEQLNIADLRELSQLFAEIADALEGK